ncbi:transposable element Tcb1 transposase [Trichonephila clavipes]|nr:transposable element Tcb1 transposase [Trichonephila clavipes]
MDNGVSSTLPRYHPRRFCSCSRLNHSLMQSFQVSWQDQPVQILHHISLTHAPQAIFCNLRQHLNNSDYTHSTQIPSVDAFNGTRTPTPLKIESIIFVLSYSPSCSVVHGTAIRGFTSGRPRGTTPADDRYIVLQARRNRRQTAGEIARHTTEATGRPISRFTVARRLHGVGLFARRPVRCVPLTPAHRRRRSLWCREHRNWRDNEWG